MLGSRKIASIAVVCAMVVALGIFLNRRIAPVTQRPGRAAVAGTAPAKNRWHIYTHPASAEDEVAGQADQNDPEAPSREKVEEYLQLHRRDMASLLVAFHELNDTNYLREAATNFPKDPRLQWTILARNAFPEERRKWLDSLKTSSPSNSLANYLSAQDYFKNGRTNEALQELFAASGKPQFSDYSMESILDAEAFGKFAGQSAAEIRQQAFAAVGNDAMPELADFKSVARSIQALQQQYAASGDSASVQNLAEAGVNFANRMTAGDGGKFVINQLVGFAADAIVVSTLDQNTSYDFLGGQTPAQWMNGLRQQRVAIRDLAQNAQQVLPNLDEDQLNSYWERVKIYGELNAMQWLKEQQAVTPNNGN